MRAEDTVSEQAAVALAEQEEVDSMEELQLPTEEEEMDSMADHPESEEAGEDAMADEPAELDQEDVEGSDTMAEVANDHYDAAAEEEFDHGTGDESDWNEVDAAIEEVAAVAAAPSPVPTTPTDEWRYDRMPRSPPQPDGPPDTAAASFATA